MMRKILPAMLSTVLVVTSLTKGEWNQVTYQYDYLITNVNKGTNTEGYSYASLRPGNGEWTENFSLQALISSLKVWSARNIQFGQWNAVPADAGQNSQITFKICLSQKVTSVTWNISSCYRNISGSGTLAARYSTNGVNFTTCYTYPTGSGDIDPPPQILTFSQPTNVIYVGWSATAPVFYNPSFVGPLTFTPAPPPVISMDGHQLLVDGTPLRGLFVIWHYPWSGDDDSYRSEFQRMKSMGVVGVGLDVGWDICEPTDGNFNFESHPVNRVIALAAAEGLWVHLLLAPHSAPPAWVMSKYGDITLKDNNGATVESNFLPFSPSCQSAATDQVGFQSNAINYFQRYHNIIAFFLTNEQGYRGLNVDYSTWALTAWHTWLCGISTDPVHWQIRWSAPNPVDPAATAIPVLETEGRKWKDWMRFRSEEFNRYLNQLYDGAVTGRSRFIPVGHKLYAFNPWWGGPREWGVRYSVLKTKMDIMANDDYNQLSTAWASELSFGKPILTAETNRESGTPDTADGKSLMAKSLLGEFFHGGQIPTMYCWNNVEDVSPWGMFHAGTPPTPLTGTLGAQADAGIFSGITDNTGLLIAKHAVLVPADKILTRTQIAGDQFHGGFMYLNDRIDMAGWYSNMIYSDDVKPSCYIGRSGTGLSLSNYKVISSMTVNEPADTQVLESTELQNWVNAGGVLFLELWETTPPSWTGITAVTTSCTNYSWSSDARYFRAVANAFRESKYALSTTVGGSKTFARWDGDSRPAILAVPRGSGWVVVVGTGIFTDLCQDFTWPILWDVMYLAGYTVPVSPVGPTYLVQGKTLFLGTNGYVSSWSGTANLPPNLGGVSSITQYNANAEVITPTISCPTNYLTGTLGTNQFCIIKLFSPISLFYDGFESGNFSAGGWQNNGCNVVTNEHYAGSRSAKLNSTDTLIKALSTVGYKNIQLTCARRTNTYTIEHFVVYWSADGTNYTALEELTASTGWGTRIFNLPIGANNNPNFRIKFRVYNPLVGAAYVDEVRITGEAIP